MQPIEISPQLKLIIEADPALRLRLIYEEVSLGEIGLSVWDGNQDILSTSTEYGDRFEPGPVTTVHTSGTEWRIEANCETPANCRLQQTIRIQRSPHWANAFILQAAVENRGSQPVKIDRLTCPSVRLGDWLTEAEPGARPWTFQGAAVSWGQDFAFPLPHEFMRDNFLGHLNNAEGGGIPLLYFWNQRVGLALAHIEPEPKDWYMPVSVDSIDGVTAGLELRQERELLPGEAVSGLATLFSIHQGDFFSPLSLYRETLAERGLLPAPPDPEDYAPAWCSWGYEFDVLPSEITGVLPVLKELGIHWLTLDDRWFDRYGDWNPRADTFPGGEAQMREMVDALHQAGSYAQLWWYPLAVEDGVGGWESHAYGTADILHAHPDWLILNEDGSPARNDRGLAVLDPAIAEVQDYISAQTRRFILDWGFDGHKLDNIYSVPACYNPAHRHSRPQQSTEALATVYRIIHEITRTCKPYSVTQICPCGTPPTISLLPYMDQAVTADPTSSAQIRQRIKFYKALLGPRAAVFADHVELSDGGIDFASEIGTGGVPATKFIWPPDPGLSSRLKEWWALTGEKQQSMKRWLAIYSQYHLSDGEYLNLYDLAFDYPEGHAIRKENNIYYAFYVESLDGVYNGQVILRGLGSGKYQLRDYVRNQPLGFVQGTEASLEVRFQGSLLLEASPAQA